MMKPMIRRIAMVTPLLTGAIGFGGAPAFADGQGAITIECSAVSPELGGTIVFTPPGGLLGNCYQHVQGEPGTSEGGGASIVDCGEALGPDTVGIQVITPDGAVYTNCHVHVT